MARPKPFLGGVGKALNEAGAGRNWNTVTRLLRAAEEMEDGS
jgi:hypothetical protein